MSRAMHWHECPSCGSRFVRDQPWKRVCFACWKASKKTGTSAATSAEIDNLNLIVQGLRFRIAELEAERMPDGMLSRLIRLAHPDRHGNSQAANVATQWLLSLRRRESLK